MEETENPDDDLDEQDARADGQENTVDPDEKRDKCQSVGTALTARKAK
jgi:hypothetical protein